jgi:ABC-type Fe3+ transport system permease subunit
MTRPFTFGKAGLSHDQNHEIAARALIGEDAQTGTVRLLALILAFVVIFGTLFWWLGQRKYTMLAPSPSQQPHPRRPHIGRTGQGYLRPVLLALLAAVVTVVVAVAIASVFRSW